MRDYRKFYIDGAWVEPAGSQTLDVINPGERVELDTLVADALQGGEQSCVVLVQSPDVPKAGPELKNVKTVSVIEPKLTLTLSGSEKRYTGTSAKPTWPANLADASNTL